MILDTLANARLYCKVHPGFAKAFEFFHRTDLTKLAAGDHAIDGSKILAKISFPDGIGQAKARLEAHRKYIDIQVCLSGTDVIGWKAQSACQNLVEPWNSDKDYAFWGDAPDSWFSLPPQHFAIFFPGDAHAPLAGQGKLHKVVIKVATEG